MPDFNWKDLLTQWNQELLGDEEIREKLPPEVIASGWLGYPGATEEQLAKLEKRLGATLPPSYREFLKFTNGWREAGYFIYTLWSTEDIDWYVTRHRDLIEAWLAGSGEPYPIPDGQYFIYGPGQVGFREEYLYTALEISEEDPGGDGVFLLNPQIVTPEGEWEAWFFAAWSEGATRHRSFWEMMQHEHESFLQLREGKTKQKPSLMDQIQEILNDEDSETRKFGEWLLKMYQFFGGDESGKTP